VFGDRRGQRVPLARLAALAASTFRAWLEFTDDDKPGRHAKWEFGILIASENMAWTLLPVSPGRLDDPE
jgi:hypothetical protein